MRRGDISIYDAKSDTMLHRTRYYSKSYRDKIISQWKKNYGSRFYTNCYIQITPMVAPESYNRLTGKNMRYRIDGVKYRASERVKLPKRTIIAYNPDGSIFGQYKSLREASVETNISHVSIMKYIKTGETFKNMVFKEKFGF